MELTTQLKKYIKSLHSTKHRQKYNKFIAEGPKVCHEFIIANKYSIEYVFGTSDWFAEQSLPVRSKLLNNFISINEKQLKQISNLKTPNKVMIICDQKLSKNPVFDAGKWSIILDEIQDPGNMGTIIRIADWFGIPKVYSTFNSANYYNPKVIQAAMGSHNRVQMTKIDHQDLINSTQPKYGLQLDGLDITKSTDLKPGHIFIGNESKGLSHAAKSMITQPLKIPKLGGAESLNAAVAAGIACYHLTQS